MKRPIGIPAAALLTAALALSGCDDAAEKDTVRLTISPRGGQLNHGPLTLTVPVGAVREAVDVTVILGGSETPDPGILPGTLVSVQPESLRFLRPVDLTLWFSSEELPSTANADNTRLVKREGGSWVPIGSSTDIQRWASGSISELGTFAVRTSAVTPADAGADTPSSDAGSDGADGTTATDSLAPDGSADGSAADGSAPDASDATASDLPRADATGADQAAADQASVDQAGADQASADQSSPATDAASGDSADL